jgi:hypothetical protein
LCPDPDPVNECSVCRRLRTVSCTVSFDKRAIRIGRS